MTQKKNTFKDYIACSKYLIKKKYTYDEHTERIKPVENRLVIHNPLRLHGVSKVKEGVRKAFLANAWTKKPSTFDAGENVNGSFEFVNWKVWIL